MPPAEPAKERRARTKGTTKRTALRHTCGSRIRIPDGWTVGPAVRRHYWAKHRTVMQPAKRVTR